MSEEIRQQPDSRQANQSGTHRRTIVITCPSCGVRMRVGAQFAGRKGKCKNCGTVLEIPAQEAPGPTSESREAVQQTAIPAPPASLSASPGMDAPPTIAAAPPADAAPTHTAYSGLPWYRRGGVLTGFTVAAILTLFLGYGTIPCIPVCIAVLTGDVYYDKRDPGGSLKKWGWPNKVAAIVLVLLNIVPFASVFLAASSKSMSDSDALPATAAYGDIDRVRSLLSSGADVDTQNADGNTALMLAAFNGHKEVLRLLMASDADVNARNPDGQTALFMAAMKGYAEVVGLLLESKADADCADERRGCRALHMAVYYTLDRMYDVRMLVDRAGAIVERYMYDPYGHPYVTEMPGRGDMNNNSQFQSNDLSRLIQARDATIWDPRADLDDDGDVDQNDGDAYITKATYWNQTRKLALRCSIGSSTAGIGAAINVSIRLMSHVVRYRETRREKYPCCGRSPYGARNSRQHGSSKSPVIRLDPLARRMETGVADDLGDAGIRPSTLGLFRSMREE